MDADIFMRTLINLLLKILKRVFFDVEEDADQAVFGQFVVPGFFVAAFCDGINSSFFVHADFPCF